MSGTLVTVHPGHAVVVSPTLEGECSFVTSDFHTAGLLDVEARTNQCRQPTTHTAVGHNGLAAGLCVHHAAHVRACLGCARHVASVTEPHCD